MFTRVIAIAGGLILAGSLVSFAQAAPSGLSGRITNDAGTGISGVAVTASQSGLVVATTTSQADGSYSLAIPEGVYSLRMASPTPEYGSLDAYSLSVSMGEKIDFTLTRPTPGRAFVTGNVMARGLTNLRANMTFELGSSAVGPDGAFRITPTAGATSTLRLTGTATSASGASMEFRFQQATPFTITQDSLIELDLPVGSQQLCVVTSAGTVAANSRIRVGMGYVRAPAGRSIAYDVLGSFNVAYQVDAVTDANGCTTIPVLTTAQPTTATFSITPPASLGFDFEWIDATVGSGPLTLTLRNPVTTIRGTVKDQSGSAFAGAQMTFLQSTGGTWTTTGQDGSYVMTRPTGSVGTLTGSWSGAGVMPPLSWRFTSTATTTLNAPTTVDVTVPTEVTQVTVTDSAGRPVANAGVYLTLNGRGALGPGVPSATLFSYSVAYTDARGVAAIRALRLSAATAGQTLTIDPPKDTGLAWRTVTVTAGAGAPISVQLMAPTIRMTGRITTSDGSLVRPRISWGDSNSMSSTVDANGNFVVTKLVGGSDVLMVTGASDSLSATGFNPILIGSTRRTATADVVQNLVIPTYKTRVRVTDPSGAPLRNVQLTLNVGDGMNNPNGSLSWIPGEGPYTVKWISSATTDSNGWASLTSITTSAPLPAYLLLTPDPTSRYQMRNVTITVGNGSQNVIVLTIPRPAITSTAVSTIGGVRTATVTGSNFLGTISVRVGTATITNFRVIDNATITFPIPRGMRPGVVTVTNGGGSATSTTTVG
jgi:hypothetical protein